MLLRFFIMKIKFKKKSKWLEGKELYNFNLMEIADVSNYIGCNLIKNGIAVKYEESEKKNNIKHKKKSEKVKK